MDKMEGLRAGVVEMRSVAQRLNQWADDLEASFRDPEAAAEEVPAAGPIQAAGRKRHRARKPYHLENLNRQQQRKRIRLLRSRKYVRYLRKSARRVSAHR